MKIDFLFVYGKLREFYTQEETFDVESLVTRPVYTLGLLFDMKGEAVLIDDMENKVYGNLVSSTNMDLLIRHTDSFMEFDEEDFSHSRYVRVVKEVYNEIENEKMRVWCYVMPSSRKDVIEKNSKLVENGDWLEYLKQKKLEEDKSDEDDKK